MERQKNNYLKAGHEIRMRNFPSPIFVLQQILQICERHVAGTWLLHVVRRCFVIPFGHLVPRMLIFVTVDTQQLPVAAVRRVVIVVVILMMDRELSDSLA